MTKQEIKETVQDEIELERREFHAARAELYREQSMHGGDGPWNDYGGDYEKSVKTLAAMGAMLSRSA